MDDNVEFEILKEILIVIHDFHEHALSGEDSHKGSHEFVCTM